MGIFNKKSNYIDVVNEVTQSLNEYKMFQLDNSKTFMVTRFVKDINDLLYRTTLMTSELLDEKGFSKSLILNRVAKSVFLNTEISELADAIKKNLGKEEEGFEIADIIIRSTNFLCAIETFKEYEKLSLEVQKNSIAFENKFFKIPVFNFSGMAEEDAKLNLVENMMRIWNDINTSSELMVHAYRSKDSRKGFTKLFIGLWNHIMELTALCEVYTDMFLSKNLHYYIDKKMNKNFERPFRYNISGNIDK